MSARLHDDPLADQRPHRQPDGEGRQPRHREPDRADDDRAGRAGASSPSRCRRSTCRRSRRTWPTASCRSPRRRRTPTPQPATGALTFVDNAVDTTTDTIKLKATLRQPRPPAVARPVRARHRCGSRRCRNATVVPSAGGADRPGRPVRLRREARFDRRAARRSRSASASNEDVVIEQGTEAGRDGRDRGTAAPRAGLARHSRPRRRRRRRGGGGAAAAVGAGRRRRSAAARIRIGLREPLRDLHPAADRDQPADGGASRCSASSRTARCRSAICRRSTTRR